MTVVARAAGLLVLLAALWVAVAHAAELEHGVNQSGLIDFPTALSQPSTHSLNGTLELTDIGKPALNLYSVRYGFQYGAFQLVSDAHFLIEPVHEFDYGEVRGKLQVLSLDEFRSTFAVGLLGRFVRKAEEREARIDGKTASLFVISTFELFPFRQWGGFLINAYLDNRFVTLGLKAQIYQSVQAVAEVDHLHSTHTPDDTNGRIGVSFEGLQNFYLQLLWTDEGKHALVQVGTSF